MDTLFYAHRGSSQKFAENTRAAYLQAIDEGADGIECDVHLSRDGVVVCHHDPTVDRTSDASGEVSRFSFSQLQEMDFASYMPVEVPTKYGNAAQQLLSLAQLLELIDESEISIGLAIEVKHPSPYGHLLEVETLKVLADFGFDPHTGTAGQHGQIQVTLMSFEPNSIRFLARSVNRELLCQLMTEIDPQRVDDLFAEGQVVRAGVYEVMRRSVAEGRELINAGGAGIIGPGIAWVRANEHLLRQWLAQGLTARIWTVDRAADAQYLMNLGVTQITSNRPAALREELEQG